MIAKALLDPLCTVLKSSFEKLTRQKKSWVKFAGFARTFCWNIGTFGANLCELFPDLRIRHSKIGEETSQLRHAWTVLKNVLQTSTWLRPTMPKIGTKMVSSIAYQGKQDSDWKKQWVIVRLLLFTCCCFDTPASFPGHQVSIFFGTSKPKYRHKGFVNVIFRAKRSRWCQNTLNNSNHLFGFHQTVAAKYSRIRPFYYEVSSEPLLLKVACCIPVLLTSSPGKCAARVLRRSDIGVWDVSF